MFLFTTQMVSGQCVSLTTLGSAVTQNFDALSNVAGSTTNNLTITGWFMTESGGGARDNEQYAVDTGGSTTGDTYSYGAAGGTDRALGGLRSGTLIPLFGSCFTNNTGSTITSLSIAYTGEEWRLGTAARTDQINFEYSLNSTDLNTGTWTGVAALTFITPVTTTTGAKDGNAAANRTTLSTTITGLSIPNGATFWLRWTDTDATGADDGLAIDDFSLTPNGASLIFYRDMDNDTYGDPTNTIMAASPPPGYVNDNTDCNDNDASVHPNAPETCDGCDKDCDGFTGDGVAPIACGLTTPPNCAGVQTCVQQAVPFPGACLPGGGTLSACNNNPQPEVCDGIDNNCNSIVDDGVPPSPCVPAGTPAGLVYGGTSQCRQGSYDCISGLCIGFIGPGPEVCDGIDNDCDGSVDEGVPGAGQLCEPQPGIVYGGNSPCQLGTMVCINGFFVCQGGVGPAPEICDGIDNDCDGTVDDGVQSSFYADSDMDGFGDPNTFTMDCVAPEGFVSNDEDCDDNNVNINPNASEVCNGLDDDCNNMIDDNLGGGQPVYTSSPNLSILPDNGCIDDTNGVGNGGVTDVVSVSGIGVLDGTTRKVKSVKINISHTWRSDIQIALVAPGGTTVRLANNTDTSGDNFNCTFDDGAAVLVSDVAACGNIINCTTDPGPMVRPLDPLSGFNGEDANGNWTLQICDRASADLGTLISWTLEFQAPTGSGGMLQTWYADTDNDGYGDPNVPTEACTQPPGYVADNTDCNDNDASVHTPLLYYVDADQDGYGSTTTAMLCSSTAPAGYSTNNTDCNDNDASVHSLQSYYVDADNDGYGSTATAMLCSATAPAGYSTNNTDCNDNDASVHSLQSYYVDADNDGYGSTATAMLCSATAPAGYSTNNTDCNDNDNTIYPGAPEICDSKDNNCNGQTDETQPVPPPWATTGIGESGSSMLDPCPAGAPQFVVNATGYSPNVNNDAIQETYQTLCGNSSITVHVTSVSGGGWAGITMRESTATGSKMVALKTQLTNFVRREVRSITGGPKSTQQIPSVPPPSWLRIQRSGSIFSFYTSTNGTTWNLVGTQTVAMNSCLLVGMFAESININTTTTATFDNVTVTGSGPIVPLAGVNNPGFEVQEQQAEIDFTLYPNPTNGQLVIGIGNAPAVLESVVCTVYNSQGQQILQRNIAVHGQTETIDLSSFANGVYWVRIQGDNIAPGIRKVVKVDEGRP